MCLLKVILVMILTDVINSQDVICRFYGYSANCRYRLDGVAMTIIKATVNKCSDPIDISFNIKNDNPPVDWSHTFSNDQEVENVDGFSLGIQLQVSLSYDEKGLLSVKADFDVEKMQKAYFLDEKIHITALEECIGLNKAGHIAVGCLIALLVIASVLLIILLYMRHKRKQQEHQILGLVNNVESPCESECPVGQPTVRFNAQAHQQASNQNSSSSHVTFLPNGQITNSGGGGGGGCSLPV